jgi:hypothetical protein
VGTKFKRSIAQAIGLFHYPPTSTAPARWAGGTRKVGPPRPAGVAEGDRATSVGN